jgi:coenzyme F420-0:L-glutamate ligase / coenzyme F420-1:gamma-L-glutamate ligase
MTTWDMAFRAIPGIPLVQPGDDLPAAISKAAEDDGLTITDGDVLVVAQKIVSKYEGRVVRLDTVIPNPRAERLGASPVVTPGCASSTLTNPRQSSTSKGRHIVTIHRLGFERTGDTAASKARCDA